MGNKVKRDRQFRGEEEMKAEVWKRAEMREKVLESGDRRDRSSGA